MDLFKDIEEFHKKFGLNYDGPVRMLDPELQQFRSKFMREEFEEYVENVSKLAFVKELQTLFESGAEVVNEEYLKGLEGALDALVDLVYVAIGTAYLHGFDFNEAWRRVHAANMAKVRAEKASDSKRGTTYDVVKPPGWKAPTHRDLVIDHAHQRVEQ